MRRWLLAAVAGGGVAAAPPEALVAPLGAPDYADREAAGRELLAAGPAAVPALEAAARSANPEVARRAADLLARLRRSTDSARLLAVPTVRLDYRGVPLAAAANDLRVKTGLPLALDPGGVADVARPVTCSTAELPVWEAVETFRRAAGLREVFAAEQPFPKPNGDVTRQGYYVPPPPLPAADAVPIVLADGPERHLPGTRSAAVRVLALPADFPRNHAVLGTGEVALHLDVTPAPGLHWQGVAAVRVTRVVDEFGRPGSGGVVRTADPPPFALLGGRGVALRWDPDGRPLLPPAFPNPRVVPLPLVIATRHARSLRRLEGAVVGVVTEPGAELAAVDRPAAGSRVDGAGGVWLTVLDCEPAGRGAVVRVQAELPSPWPEDRRRNPWGPVWPDPARTPAHGHQLVGLDPDGKPVPAGAASVTRVSDDGQTLTTVWQVVYPLGVPARLVLTGPKPVVVEVPFVMEDVPLP
ncbi:MAG: hypothetical protein K2X87_20930 [Gemmataceae bacterium]|nr:hypothetical protein [Gemmataceae bacterium]